MCIVYDDIADSCKQLCEASQFLKDMGAQAVHVLCTHGLFSEKGLQVLNLVMSCELPVIYCNVI